MKDYEREDKEAGISLYTREREREESVRNEVKHR